MRWTVALVLLGAACGGSPCEVTAANYSFHAMSTFTTAGCETQPASFDVSASISPGPNNTYTLTGTENGVAFTATGTGESSDCYALPTWNEPGVTHMYFLDLKDGQSRLDVVRSGQCMVSYSLR